ncbi:hypothetical protein Patl1_21950 [Pistacia atlantica]|uniref:Uncharacterized protein n=1 Tax=Pistacia atlantica TaxID=434234 RepID=A0ACC1BJC5_9ROSI|nr:hypothetical protein Patl1_21950 [Pistacia atlantica]
MAQDTRDVANGSRCDPSRCLYAKHFRYLFQDSYCPWHGSRHPLLQGARQTPRPLCGYILEIFVHKVFARLSQLTNDLERPRFDRVAGESHARPPTESRPGHVALIAGFYEDPSAVTKGWKANPVEFDSVFNQNQHTISDVLYQYGSVNAEASFLDEWSSDQFQTLLNRSNEDPKLKELLLQDNRVISLHLLGCDSNGHAHWPFSSIYLNKVKVIDHIAKRSHGDGHPTNTDTPLIVWETGVNYPKPLSGTNHSDCGFRFVDEYAHDTPTAEEWGLHGIEGVDVNQADIAPIMSTHLGLPCPVNSVGNLPPEYIKMNEVSAVDFIEK